MVKRVDLCEKEKQRQKEKHKMMCEKMFKPLSSKPDIVGKKNSIILCRLAWLKPKIIQNYFEDFFVESDL